ncbi:E3 ubiquitin-protein ligase RNF216 isoform X2 [Cynoglossus semilaevis]|uniref:E3 ubiquitin-protein ligase RNF216 isoform X2 n=1 Tax=Cynoglossus semilaevis TaxID=244447 RepID=UPI000D62C546|nr:E3 ubiquitin-protein ligase RNF216 isoform X2 [Cynoglossus semilaevis]
MADGGSDDEVIHLASFNVHRSQRRSAKKRVLITISDDSNDSDEEPMIFIPGSPVLVPDDGEDDDISILEHQVPPQRLLIRPAAKWGTVSSRLSQTVSSSSQTAVIPAVNPSLAPSTSRHATASSTVAETATRTETAVQPGTSGDTQPQPGSSSSNAVTQNSSKPDVTSQQDSTLTNQNVELQAVSTVQNTSTSTTATAEESLGQATPGAFHAQPSAPGASSEPRAGCSAQIPVRTTACSSARATHYSGAATASVATMTKTEERAGPSSDSQDNPQASTSSAHAQPQPVTQRQWQPRAHNQVQFVSSHQMQGNLIQIEPQPLAQAPAQPPVQAAQPPQAMLVNSHTVLIAAAPERLGPLEPGHRIVLGSQVPGEAEPMPPPQAGVSGVAPAVLGFNIMAPHVISNPIVPPASTASVPDNRGEARLITAPNPERVTPLLEVVAVPRALEAIPQIEDARPGPSGGMQLPPHIRGPITVVLDLFPDVQEAYVAELMQKNNVKDVNVICNLLLENPDYPRRETAAVAAAAPSSILLESGNTQTDVAEDLFDYAKLGTVGLEAVMQAADLLMSDFRMLSCQDIKWALNAMKGHYAITRKALCEALKKWQDACDPSGKRRRSRTSSERCYIDFYFEHGSVKLTRRMYFLENDRRYCRTYNSLEASVQKELVFYQQKAKEWAEHEDFLLALQVNEDEYKKDGQLIECGCCYGEFAFEKMTQCSDGHLFCKECLVKYAQEAVFGSGRSELSCIEGGCLCSYPVCELEKVLPENILCKYYERQAEEAVAATCADELVRCPFCNFPALLDKHMSLFSCPNPRCRKESCRKCHVQWKQHMGKTCEQVLERDEIRTRILFEERMTAARVRKCVKCTTGLVKSEGCNRLLCRCGSAMCYLCRELITGYNHFCQHARSPGAPCRHCRKCSLWTDPTQQDEEIIQEIQREGEAELTKKSADNAEKRVGPSPVIAAKRPRVGPPPENQPNPNNQPALIPPPRPLPRPLPPPPPHPQPHPQAVQAPLFVPPHAHYPPPPNQVARFYIPQRLRPAPYVPHQPHMPHMNNFNNNHNYHHHNHNPPVNPTQFLQNLDGMDLPMHYGPAHRHYRGF